MTLPDQPDTTTPGEADAHESGPTVSIDLRVALPDVDADDGCVGRFEEAVKALRGVLRAHVAREEVGGRLCIHYDPNLASLNDLRAVAERTGAQVHRRYRHDVLTIEGMDCSDCIVVIEHALRRLDGVLSAHVGYAAQRLRVEYDSEKTSRSAVERRIRSLGYVVSEEGARRWLAEHLELLKVGLAGLLVLAGWTAPKVGAPWWGSTAAYIAAYLAGGLDVARHAFQALSARKFDTDVLMLAAALGAGALGELGEGALLLFLFSFGHVLEERTLDRARRAVSALAHLAPKTALVRRDGTEYESPIEALALNDMVIVRPGARIPVDGDVAAGTSAVDQSPVTGESVPVEKADGDKVFAGTINGNGALEVRVQRLARDSTLSRVMRMVEEAQTQKSPTQQTVERFERVFVPAILVATGLVATVPHLLGFPFRDSFLRAMTLLVAASPCALALGTPAAILAGIAQAARYGVLIKGGVHLENLGRLKAMAFDKTGTLTHGRPVVTDIVTFAADVPGKENGLLALAAALESRSGHPLSQAVVLAARERALDVPEVAGIESLTARGLRGDVNGVRVLVGNRRLMDEANVMIDAASADRIAKLQTEGRTIMLVALDGRLAGVVAVADTLRPAVRETMTSLRGLGVEHTVMLTGDNVRVAQAIAEQVGVTDIRADLLPEAKLEAIHRLGEEYSFVAMVGDGVNDAPALASATLGIAMGGAGTDVALETADVVLMGNDLGKLPFAVCLGKASRSVIRQNLGFSLAIIALLVVLALLGVAGIGWAIVVHEGSTLLVVLNALRLLNVNPSSVRA